MPRMAVCCADNLEGAGEEDAEEGQLPIKGYVSTIVRNFVDNLCIWDCRFFIVTSENLFNNFSGIFILW